jgi:acyl carrier protein
MTNQQRVKQFIVDNFYVTDPSALQDDTSLIEGGYVDSTGMLELIAFLENAFGIRVGEAETVPENLETIARIVAFVARKSSSGSKA